MYIYRRQFIQFFVGLSLLAPLGQAMQKPISYHGAGIVPYAVDQNNEVYILVGIEPGRGNQAFDFGGAKDPEDKENPAFTAAREGSEELLFLYDENDQDFRRLLNLHRAHGKAFNLYRARSRTYERILDKIRDRDTSFQSFSGGYVTHFVKISFRTHVPQLFKQRYQQYAGRLPYCWAEKSHLVWLKLKDVVNALGQSKDLHNIFVPTNQGRQVHIFYPFAQSLKTADQNGTLKLLK